MDTMPPLTLSLESPLDVMVLRKAKFYNINRYAMTMLPECIQLHKNVRLYQNLYIFFCADYANCTFYLYKL